jgi:hypothetical protein
VDVAYLTSPSDRAQLVDASFRDRVVEALIAAVQRMYLPVEQDVKTGSIDVSTLRAAGVDEAATGGYENGQLVAGRYDTTQLPGRSQAVREPGRHAAAEAH